MPMFYRHGCGLSAASIIGELPLSVHVPRWTVPWMRGEYWKRDCTVREMGLLSSQLLRCCLRRQYR